MSISLVTMLGNGVSSIPDEMHKTAYIKPEWHSVVVSKWIDLRQRNNFKQDFYHGHHCLLTEIYASTVFIQANMLPYSQNVHK